MQVIRAELGDATGHEAITPDTVKGITSTLVTPTSGQYTGFIAKAALITVESNTIRFRTDGTDPETDEGHPIVAGDSYIVRGGGNVKRLRFLDVSAAATVMVTVFH